MAPLHRFTFPSFVDRFHDGMVRFMDNMNVTPDTVFLGREEMDALIVYCGDHMTVAPIDAETGEMTFDGCVCFRLYNKSHMTFARRAAR